MSEQTDLSMTVNGRLRPYREQTLHELLLEHSIDPDLPGTAVAVNAEVVARAGWAARLLRPGDQVEIVQAQAGG